MKPEDIGKKLLEPGKLKPEDRQQIKATLDTIFGTPRHPLVDLKAAAGAEDAAELQQLQKNLKLDETTLARGSVLYREHCLHCHGVMGNGRGPTAPWVNPHPRDYRQGVFKFTSTSQGELGNNRKPRRADLLRTLREGIEGTSMPSFGLLAPDQLDDLASYVMHLSIRGQSEFLVMKELLEKGTLEDTTVPDRLKEYVRAIAGWWQASQAEQNLIQPGVPAPEQDQALEESVKRGSQLFKDCLQCHIDYGRKPNYLFDEWGTIVRPADLTAGVYRGGRRPIDLYWRIFGGINGSGMPSANKTPQETWDLVNFVRALPYPGMRQKYGIRHPSNKEGAAARSRQARADVQVIAGEVPCKNGGVSSSERLLLRPPSCSWWRRSWAGGCP